MCSGPCWLDQQESQRHTTLMDGRQCPWTVGCSPGVFVKPEHPGLSVGPRGPLLVSKYSCAFLMCKLFIALRRIAFLSVQIHDGVCIVSLQRLSI